jgi:hypothetical protein
LCGPTQPRSIIVSLQYFQLPLKKAVAVVRFWSHKTAIAMMVVWVQNEVRELHVEDVLAGASMVCSLSYL